MENLPPLETDCGFGLWWEDYSKSSHGFPLLVWVLIIETIKKKFSPSSV